VLSRQAFRACGAPGEAQLPGGLSWEALTLATGEALRSPGCRGWSVAIYNPDLDPDRSDAARIVAFARDASAKTIDRPAPSATDPVTRARARRRGAT
jgi:arginase